MSSSMLSKSFFFRLFRSLSSAYLFVFLVAMVYVYLMQFIDHKAEWIAVVIVVLATLKTIYFTLFTFKQASLSIRQCHSFRQLLWIFGMLIFLIIFSFAADYTCLSENELNSFSSSTYTSNLEYSEMLFEFFYFSVVTFASIGYGDIVPLSVNAKILVLLEIGQSFVLVVFGLSNINNIHNLVKNKM